MLLMVSLSSFMLSAIRLRAVVPGPNWSVRLVLRTVVVNPVGVHFGHSLLQRLAGRTDGLDGVRACAENNTGIACVLGLGLGPWPLHPIDRRDSN